MVSERKKSSLTAFDKLSMKPLREPVPIRLKFIKTGDLQYISHLDLQRVMSRVIVRSGVPAWYTQGFNPHAKMVFSMPLSVGAQSVCEYLDIKIDREISTEEILERLNAQVTDEMRFTAAYTPQSKLSEIAFVKYEIDICTDVSDAALADRAREILTTRPLNMMKRSKSGEREVDILEYFKSVEVSADETLKISVVLKGGEGSLNPEMIVSALRERLGILASDEESYTIMRTAVYFADGREFE
jgi:radical SAM-linked protein